MNVRVDAARGDDQPFAGDGFGGDADDHAGRDAGHHVGIARLADAGDASALDADVGFADPGPIHDERVCDDTVERVFFVDTGRLAHAVAQYFAAAELALVAVHGVVAFDLGDKLGVAKADPVAGGRAEDGGVVGAGESVRHGCDGES